MVKYSLIKQRNLKLMYLKILQREQFKRIRKDTYHQKRKKIKKIKKNLGPKIQNLRISRLAFSKNYIVIFEIRTLKFLLVESLAK